MRSGQFHQKFKTEKINLNMKYLQFRRRWQLWSRVRILFHFLFRSVGRAFQPFRVCMHPISREGTNQRGNSMNRKHALFSHHSSIWCCCRRQTCPSNIGLVGLTVVSSPLFIFFFFVYVFRDGPRVSVCFLIMVIYVGAFALASRATQARIHSLCTASTHSTRVCATKMRR